MGGYRLPGELKAARVVLFIVAGLALVTFFSYIVLRVDYVSLGLAYVTYVGQGVLTLILGMLIAPGRQWLVWAIGGYSAVVSVGTVLMVLGGDVGSLAQLLIPVLLMVLVTRPRARACLTATAPI